MEAGEREGDIESQPRSKQNTSRSERRIITL